MKITMSILILSIVALLNWRYILFFPHIYIYQVYQSVLLLFDIEYEHKIVISIQKINVYKNNSKRIKNFWQEIFIRMKLI